MPAILVPTKTYESLLKKARTLDRILSVTKESFPVDEYSELDIAQFKKMDRVPIKQKRVILQIIKKIKSGGKI